jgi:hypothetical protein
MNCQIIFLVGLVMVSPVFAQEKNGFNLTGSAIPAAEIISGGPPRDGIPALTKPQFIGQEEADYLSSTDRVIGVFIGGEAKAYPIKILDYHEIVNDRIDDKPIVVTYCPLCGSGIVFDAMVENTLLEFGVSGLLYNSDVLLYDRQTESLWSQLMTEAVTGKMRGSRLTIIDSDHTTWGDWVERYPGTAVLSLNTGYGRNYMVEPYRGYEDTERLYFPVSHSKKSFPNKERVLGIEIKGSFKAYPVSTLSSGENVDVFKGISLIINYSPENQSIKATSDNEPVKQMITYWFAWYTFHPYTKVYKP